MTEIPKKGDRYRHSSLRGVWTVQSAGVAYVTLKPSLPQLKSQRIPTKGFMTAGWEKV